MRQSNQHQLEKLRKRLEMIPKAVLEAVKPTLETSGTELVAAMKSMAPVESGALRDSITVTPGGQTTPASAVGGSKTVPENRIAVTAGNKHVPYAGMVEFGTSHAHAQPFFLPAYRSLRGKVIENLKRAVFDAVHDRGGK